MSAHYRMLILLILVVPLALPSGAEASWSYQNRTDATASWWAGRASSRANADKMRRVVRRHHAENINRAQRVVRHPRAHRQIIRKVRRFADKGRDLRNRIGGIGFTSGWRDWIRRHYPRRVITDFGRPAALRCGEYGMIGYGIAKVIAGHSDSTAFKEGMGACMWGIHSVYRSRR